MKLVVPKLDRDRWKDIPGEFNCVGKDIPVIKIYEITPKRSYLRWSKKEKVFPDHRDIFIDNNDYWVLYEGVSYLCILDKIVIPEDCFGITKPRSTLLRLGIMSSEGAVWDPGYIGNGRALIRPTYTVTIEQGMPMFSLSLYRTERLIQYNGSYQGEII